MHKNTHRVAGLKNPIYNACDLRRIIARLSSAYNMNRFDVKSVSSYMFVSPHVFDNYLNALLKHIDQLVINKYSFKKDQNIKPQSKYVAWKVAHILKKNIVI